MGLIREPKGIDFIVGPSVLTDGDKKMISKIIRDYKETGKKPGIRQLSRTGKKNNRGKKRALKITAES